MKMSHALSRATVAAFAAATVVVLPATNSAGAAPSPCTQWTKQPVAAGYGMLENLAFDGRGNLLLSQQSVSGPGGSLQRLAANGTKSVAVADVEGPGGIVVAGDTAYFTTGNSASSALMNRADGEVRALNLDTGEVRTVATGLTMPNGLAQLPDGDLVVSRDIGAGTLTRIAPDGTTTPYAPHLSSTNGLAYDPVHHRLIVSTTFNPTTVVTSIDVADPAKALPQAVVPGFGPLNAADDLTVDSDGVAYVAMNVAGTVVRFEPSTGAHCSIADDLPFSTSVRFGAGPGWDPDSLYVTSFLGTVTRLVPPQ